MKHKHIVHEHGGVPDAAFERLNIPRRPVIDFSVNISPIGPPERILSEWSSFSKHISAYPEIHGKGIVDYFSLTLNMEKESILAGNGSVECIYLVPRVLKLKRAGILLPSFHDYSRAFTLAGTRVRTHALNPDNGFKCPCPADLSRILDQNDAIIIGNPNNPTGTLFDPEVILESAERYRDRWFLVDEAFMPFVRCNEELTLTRADRIRTNILVFRSLTKWYGLAGIRLGAVTGHPDTIALLMRHKEPWTINSIADQAARLLAGSEEYDRRLRELTASEQERIYPVLQRIKGIDVFKPSANFFFCEWRATNNLDDLIGPLLNRGIYVRDCRNFQGLNGNFFRFAIRLPDENNMLIDALKASAETLRKKQ